MAVGTTEVTQQLEGFRLPPGFRGRPAWQVQFWWLVQDSLFAWSPQFMYGWRRSLLRLFGAQIGKGVLIRPTAKVTFPWKVKIGDRSWIGDEVVIYSLGEISIGQDTVISQRSYLCAGTHDHTSPTFDIKALPIEIGPQVWIATDVFVAPGICVGEGAVVGARSSVFKSLPGYMICRGNPAVPIRPRDVRSACDS